jgi:hypothetical protein
LPDGAGGQAWQPRRITLGSAIQRSVTGGDLRQRVAEGLGLLDPVAHRLRRPTEQLGQLADRVDPRVAEGGIVKTDLNGEEPEGIATREGLGGGEWAETGRTVGVDGGAVGSVGHESHAVRPRRRAGLRRRGLYSLRARDDKSSR